MITWLQPVAAEETVSYPMRSGTALKVSRGLSLEELRKQAKPIRTAPKEGGFSDQRQYSPRIPERLLNAKNVDVIPKTAARFPTKGQAPAAGLSFGGYDSDDNNALIGFRVAPPDSEGDVGLNRYVQWNNLGFKIFDKTGTLLNGPNGTVGNIFWAGFGGPCEDENHGYPIVLYDENAGRWLFSHWVAGPGLQCVAISDGEDPAGPYTRFAFPIALAGTGDYPMIGIWTSADGSQSSYHITTNEFNSGIFLGVNLTALDRDAMLAAAADPTPGLPAFVQFTIPPASGTNPFAFSLQPGHLEGRVLPPAGTCETYLQAFDSETWGAAGGADGYRTWKFCVDFVTPENSSLVENALIQTGFEFDSNLCSFGDCVPQPNGQLLDTLSHFTMYRFAVRDVAGALSGVISHTVDLGINLAGVQWAKFDLSGVNPVLSDIGQLNVGDELHRWMPSISQDGTGNIAIGYSRSGSGALDFPSVLYTGRENSDPAGSLQAESLCVSGTGSQSGIGRWGDYSTVSIDPVDDCTFWITNEYVETTGSWQWDTQVCTFKFPSCIPLAERILFADSFEALPPVCEPSEVEACYNGPPETLGVGLCAAGTRTCDADGQWGSCSGWVGPVEEICGDGQDNDCSGAIDQGCSGEDCDPLDSDGTCLEGLGCFITSCRDNVCNAVCDAEGSGREGSVCSDSSDCRSGFQCWNDGFQGLCLQSCDPADLFSCRLGSICTSTGVFVDGQEIGACSLP